MTSEHAAVALFGSRGRNALLGLVILAAAGCGAQPPENPGDATPGPNALMVAVVDSAVRAGPAWDCFDVDGAVPSRTAADDGHAELVLSVVLGIADDPCPSWAQHVAVAIYPVEARDAVSVARAIDEATAAGADLINVSITFAQDHPDLRAAVERAAAAEAVVIAAAGNTNGLRAAFPARHEDVVSVGALGARGGIAWFSAVDGVDIFLPGDASPAVYATGERTMSTGTSFSAAALTHALIAMPRSRDVPMSREAVSNAVAELKGDER